MHIAVIASYAPSLVNFRGALLQSLAQDGHRITAYAPDFDERTTGWLRARGITCRHVSMERNGTSPVADLNTLRALTAEFLKRKPDVVFGYTAKPVIWGMLAARFANVPRRVAMLTGLGHAFIETDTRRGSVATIVRGLYATALRAATCVIFHNEDDRALFLDDRLVPHDGRAVVVPGSGVDLERFMQQPLPPFPPLRFLLITRLINEKGVREYVEAARMVRTEHPEAEFRLVGPLDSNPSGITQQEVDQWKAQGHVTVVGPVSDVRHELSKCHVYVLPSYREGCPRTNLEAMAIGRALITTDVPGCRQTVTPENGILVPERDATALARACKQLIATPNRLVEMGDASRQLVADTFDLERINAMMTQYLIGN